MRILLSTLLLISTSVFAGGGEGSSGGGAGIIIGEMLERARAKDYFVDIPTLKLKGERVKVIETCVDQDRVRTYDITDNYPEFVDIYNVPKGVEQKIQSVKIKKKYKIALYQKINLDHGPFGIKTNSRLMKVDYRIPKCR